jgi:hypothetical protein
MSDGDRTDRWTDSPWPGASITRKLQMKATMKHLFITAVLLATCSGHSLLAADAFPEFKIGSCRQAEALSRDAQACFRDEQNAKDTLQQNWKTYDSIQKDHCRRLLKAGGMPSYVELLTCVEMKPSNTTKKKGT